MAQRGDWWGRPAGVWRPPWALSGFQTPPFAPSAGPPGGPTRPPCCLPDSGPKSGAAGDGRRLPPSREGPRPEEWRRRAVAGPAAAAEPPALPPLLAHRPRPSLGPARLP